MNTGATCRWWNEYLWIHKSYFMGEFMVSYERHSAAAWYKQPKHLQGNVSLKVQSRFQLRWECTSIPAPWQYPPRLGIPILYLITPWQYLLRLGMLFYILSRLGSIRWGLACYSISYHALTVSAKGPTSKNPSCESSSRRNNPGLWKPKPQNLELQTRKAQVVQTKTCWRAGVRGTLCTCWDAEEVVDFASVWGYSKGQHGNSGMWFSLPFSCLQHLNENKKKCFHLVTWRPVASAGTKPGETQKFVCCQLHEM